MRVTPLAIHAQRRIPALTSLFSDAVDASSIAVVADGTTTITCATAHGMTTGQSVVIVDAEIPNPITAAVVNDDDTVSITTQYAHNMTTSPAGLDVRPWSTSAKLANFGSAALDGTKQLVSVEDRDQFTIQPTTPVVSITLDGGEVLLERLEFALAGMHKITAATATTLTFPTPATVTRSFSVTSPTIVKAPRCYAAANLEQVMRRYVRADATATPADKAHLFITPVDVKASRGQSARGDAIADIGDGTDYRQLIMDGFEVIVVIPSEHSPGAVAAIDKAQGEIFNAVLRTFLGLRVPQPEISASSSYVAVLEGHGMQAFDGANYYHGYRFQTQFVVVNEDAIAPFDWPDIDPDAIADTLYPVGAPPFQDLTLDGLRIKPGTAVHPGELTATVKIDEDAT